MKLFKIVSVAFWIIRQFFISNPFEVLGEGIPVVLDGKEVFLTPDVLNWIAGLGLPTLTFGIVGLYYKSGTAPVVGSALYMIFFLMHTGLLHLVSLAYPKIWLIFFIVVLYVGFHVFILSVKRRCEHL